MDIIIMIVLLAAVIAVYRGGRSGVVVGLWALGLVLTLLLFRYHATSTLDLSF